MTLSDLSIRRPVFAWMLMIGLVFFGAISLGRLGISQLPEIDFPIITVNLQWNGASPEILETELVDPIEQAVISAQGLKAVSSYIQLGQASIILEFELGRNIDSALTEVQSKISSVKLPMDPTQQVGMQQVPTPVPQPILVKDNPEEQPILLIGVSGEGKSLHDLVSFVDLVLHDELQIVPGVGQIVLAGYNIRNLRIWVDGQKLASYQLTVQDVQTAIMQEHVEVAAGDLENSRNQFNVRAMGEGLTPEEVGDIQIKKRGSELIYRSNIRIKDVAKVEDGLDDIRRIAATNGKTSLGIGIKKQPGANSVEVARLVKKKLQELQPFLPKGIQTEVVYDRTKYIEDSIKETLFTLLLSAVITSIVCYLFLGSWTATVNVLLSIPTSVLGTFIVIYFLGFTLNFFTLLGLSLAIGIIVDDAIMVLENIYRHRDLGKNRVIASRDGAREITFAAMAATVAIIAIFLPVAFMKGVIGRYFYQFGLTISAAVALSLLEAITLTPMRCSQIMDDRNKRKGLAFLVDYAFKYLAKFYKYLLKFSLSYSWLVLVVALGLFLFSLKLFSFLPQELIPTQDESSFIVRIQTPVGSSIYFTEEKLKECEKRILAHKEVDKVFGAVGGMIQRTGATDGNLVDSEVNVGTLYVTLKDRRERAISQKLFMDEIRKELNSIEDLRAAPQDLSIRGFTTGRGFPVELTIRGEDYKVLQKIVQQDIEEMKQSGYFVDLDTDFRDGMPEVRVYPDRFAANACSIPIQNIANTVAIAIGGVAQGQFTNGERRYDIRIRLQGKERVGPEDIARLGVRTNTNEFMPITAVAKLQTVKTYQTLTRKMRERAITIFSNVATGKSQAEALAVAKKICSKHLPKGYRLYLSGGAASFEETFQSLAFALWVGVVIAYMVLASQFNSFVHPFSVLLALPFSLSGALLALWFTHQSINLYSMIGLILLMGIAKKNSILLVEFTNQLREKGMSIKEALLEAGPIRLRPILMTSMATVAAALPPAFALGPGAESRIPMAITLLGGIVVSTIFTLFVVPSAYLLLSRFEKPSPFKAPPKEPIEEEKVLVEKNGEITKARR
ncbi:efflux RND transporter permease subunit [Candidatus Methylacidiphilum infernorum]|uniref:Efflux RND transporter permease subunit n=1 Tax=Candidatus Methylacidiphilum infernorum TaxID=511746 RepID=A0ABX7PWC3_9BACT|nr:efflux RND transporter permease subunit [Candidatus Methylacidiphilum infernorum]QSR87028.1 efflux RND transporter permease subunit [Candidatus Methylacidiphilum infernorum]